jgi:hypothetical protein
MSYKHNNLMAMRHNYWNDQSSPQVMNEKQFIQDTLTEFGIFQPATVDDAKYFFFSMPSIIIVKGYSLGFSNESVKKMIIDFIQKNKPQLCARTELKIQYRML